MAERLDYTTIAVANEVFKAIGAFPVTSLAVIESLVISVFAFAAAIDLHKRVHSKPPPESKAM